MEKRIIVAYDRMTVAQVLRLARTLAGQEGYWGGKFTPAFFNQVLQNDNPREVLGELRRLGGIMADFKFHDIPTTVADNIQSLSDIANIITIHTLGGFKMMEQAKQALPEEATLAGVTILTSLAEDSLADVGLSREVSVPKRVRDLSMLAMLVGINTIVCSPNDLFALDNLAGLKKITPGIRLPGGDTHDQKRVDTPDSAIRDGADYLVIGRAITEAKNPVAALAECQRLVKLGEAERKV